ncbi:MAG: hypothetical protein WCY11_09450 [Novosphingobium sp.]
MRDPETVVAGHSLRTARAAACALGGILAVVAVCALAVLVTGLVQRFDPAGFGLLAIWGLAMAAAVRSARSGRQAWVALLCAGAISLALRWWSVVLATGGELGADPMNYANLARAVLEGRGLVTDDWQYGEGLRAYFPPLYPLLLAGVWGLFGASAVSTLVLNTLTDLAAAWALGDVGRRTGGRSLGRLAMMAYFAWPAFALAAGLPQKESLTLLLCILLLRAVIVWQAADVDESARPRHGLWIGLWWGLLALTQPSLVIAPVFVSLVLVWQRGFWPVVRLGLWAMPTILAVLLPWWIRNWLVFQTFIPLTTASGIMINAALRDSRLAFPPGLFALSEPERGAIMGQLAKDFIRHNPLVFLREASLSLAYGLAFEEASLARFRHMTPALDAASHARLEPLLQGAYVAVLVGALRGCVRQFRRTLVDPVILYSLSLVLAIGAVNVWFEFGERHRLILTPFLLLLAGTALMQGRSGKSTTT